MRTATSQRSSDSENSPILRVAPLSSDSTTVGAVPVISRSNFA
jgi:hypothetical protein